MNIPIQPDKFFKEENDGLPMRDSQSYARRKIAAIKNYMEMFGTSMKHKPWRAKFYIDLQSGYGKNVVAETGEIFLGSPLVSLLATHPFTHYRFNEKNSKIHDVLSQRVEVTPLRDSIQIYQEDLNKIVYTICDEIDQIDRDPSLADQWSSLNLAFLDPEGLEVNWSTVERLAQVRKMDLIINFSTSGIRRAEGKENLESIDRFFGTPDWKIHYDSYSTPEKRRRAVIDFYLNRLKDLGYYIEEKRENYTDIRFKNSMNAEVYCLIFASKNPLGDKFWEQIAKQQTETQKRLL